jgi:hypothetical protein
LGRELVTVPPNWEHPKTVRRWGEEDYQPMHRSSYQDAKKEWIDGLLAWERGERPSYFDPSDKDMEYLEWAGQMPDKNYYVPFKEEECTWFQVWETVSEGTPVTPPFETKEELIEYLCTKGDFWDQRGGAGPWSRQSATNFVMGDGWVPSMAIMNGVVVDGRDLSSPQPSPSTEQQNEQ